MAINISVIESSKQVISGIPEYLIITITNVSNAIVYYTVDGSAPDESGLSYKTLIMEHNAGDPLNGIIYLPTSANILSLNILAVGNIISDRANFYRRYGLDDRNIGIGRPGINKLVSSGGTGYTNTPSPNITVDGAVIATDGYTNGITTIYDITESGYDGYVDGYNVALSGIQTAIPPSVYDHIDGYITGSNGMFEEYSTTTLTPGQELNLLKLSDKGNIYIDDGNGLVLNRSLPNIDPRSSSIYDSEGRQINVVPIEDYPIDGYYVDGYNVDINYDNAPIQQTTNFTSSGMFDPRAAYIEIDGRIDGYINGSPIRPGDRVILNKPYGELRYSAKREDLSDALRVTNGYISGGLVCNIYDYQKGQAAFYYADMHDNIRWVVSLQKIESPKYELFARRNGVVVGHVIPWVNGKSQILPG